MVGDVVAVAAEPGVQDTQHLRRRRRDHAALGLVPDRFVVVEDGGPRQGRLAVAALGRQVVKHCETHVVLFVGEFLDQRDERRMVGEHAKLVDPAGPQRVGPCVAEVVVADPPDLGGKLTAPPPEGELLVTVAPGRLDDWRNRTVIGDRRQQALGRIVGRPSQQRQQGQDGKSRSPFRHDSY